MKLFWGIIGWAFLVGLLIHPQLAVLAFIFLAAMIPLLLLIRDAVMFTASWLVETFFTYVLQRGCDWKWVRDWA